MAMQHSQQTYTFVNTSVPADLLNTDSHNSIYPTSFNFYINVGLLIPDVNKARHVRVLRSFNIEVQTVKDGFVATSNVSDVFELGATPAQAVLSYLYSIVDELSWLQEHKNALSLPMIKNLDNLQIHLKFM
jgi:hypothetical protein